MNLEKPDAEIIGWIIIMLWKTWNEAGKLEIEDSKKKTDTWLRLLECKA
jgi:hypothetical protein